MATPSTGITVTFGSTTLTEVTGISWQYGSGMPAGRSFTQYTPTPAVISVESLGEYITNGYGVRATIAIVGGGMNLTGMAICTGVSAAAELNGVSRFTHEFTIVV